MQKPDDAFYDRADAHIHLSNKQLGDAGAGKVSASMMYATARFNAWLTTRGFKSGESMRSMRDESIEYFVNEYRKMLEEHFEDYISNFDAYTAPDRSSDTT